MNSQKFEYDSNSLQKYLDSLQGLVARFSNLSAQIKNWSITVSAGLIALLLKSDHLNCDWLLVMPFLSFYILDTYYLSLEKSARRIFEGVVSEIELGNLSSSKLFKYDLQWRKFYLKSMTSLSTWFFYLCLSSTIVIAGIFAN